MLVEKLLSFTLLGAEWVLWLLLVLSVMSIGVMVERFIVILINTIDVEEFTEKLTALLDNGSEEDIKKLLGKRSVVHRVFLAAYNRRSEGVGSVEETTAAISAKEKLKLERNLVFLGTLGNNAPFIGLFGTVIGIIRAFHDLSLNTTEGAAAVMAGISEALVATGVGLLVAIPAVIAFNFFNRRIKSLMTYAEAMVHILIAKMKAVKSEGA